MKIAIKNIDNLLTEITNKELNREANKADKDPTDAQIKSGNYKKGHVSINGFDITIENPKGSTRSGTDKYGKKWSITMNNHYGYFKETEGKDGDHIDVFIGPNLESVKIFVVDQTNEKGEFDEHKVMLGFDDKKEAKRAYLSNYTKGWTGCKEITETSLESFKKWLYNGTKRIKPFGDYNIKENRVIFTKMSEEEHEITRIKSYKPIIK